MNPVAVARAGTMPVYGTVKETAQQLVAKTGTISGMLQILIRSARNGRKTMTDEYIRKAEAIEAVDFGITLASAINLETGEWSELFKRENDELREAIERIQKIEPADVVQVVHGKWMPQKGGGLCCSECGGYALDEPDGNFIHVAVPSKFCPNCGARMDGGKED